MISYRVLFLNPPMQISHVGRKTALTSTLKAVCCPADTFDHADIVGSISDGQCDRLLVLLDQLDHLSLLQRSDPAADHCLTHARRPQELQLHAALQGVRLRDHEGNRIVMKGRNYTTAENITT